MFIAEECHEFREGRFWNGAEEFTTDDQKSRLEVSALCIGSIWLYRDKNVCRDTEALACLMYGDGVGFNDVRVQLGISDVRDDFVSSHGGG